MEKGTKKKVQDGLREREQEVQELQSRVTVAEASLQKAQVDLQERSEEVSKLKTEMGEMEVKHAELKVERKQLEQLREEKENHGAQQQTEIGQVSHPQFRDCELQCVQVEHFNLSDVYVLLDVFYFPYMYGTLFLAILTLSQDDAFEILSLINLLSVSSQLHAKLLETERQLGEVEGRLKEQRQLSGEKLKDREQQAADLQLKLSRTEEQV